MKRFLSVLLCLAIVFSLNALTSPPSAAAENISLQVTYRDFKADGKLFGSNGPAPADLAGRAIGADGKPDFSDPLNPSQPLPNWVNALEAKGLSLKDLNSLFNDVPGVNMSTTGTLNMVQDKDGFYSLDKSDSAVFAENGWLVPLDNRLFGNESNAHNFNFSLDMHARFIYKGYEEFTFSGSGYVWVFIDGRLVMESGIGSGTDADFISLRNLVSDGTLDLTSGENYDFDLFYVQCSSTESVLELSTNIDLFNIDYGKAGDWAKPYLDKASQMGIIPDRLKGKDMTVGITREEFAETAVKFYENVTGKVAQPAAKTFRDCRNPEVLKAFGLNITAGVGDGTRFEPGASLTRQQMATMIVRTLQACYPTILIDKFDQADFKDQKLFAQYAVENAKFMARHNITSGDGKGHFIPNAKCTRQEAFTFLVKAYEAQDSYITLREVESSMQNGARVDKTVYPFEGDDSVLGKWNAVDLVDDPLSFNPDVKHFPRLNTVSLTFYEGGRCDWVVFWMENEVQSDTRTLTNDYRWTKGLVTQDTWEVHTAARYFITTIRNKEYLFVEFKNGDYVFRNATAGYHVFVRE